MNVCYFEYEHDMKLVGELLVSVGALGLYLGPLASKPLSTRGHG